ncbi:MAG: cellulase family glycosylhydrolase [Atopobiaceae bacterium]|nr:cellulase family glycosylhydrolase [Atopobiaceae bacterium]
MKVRYCLLAMVVVCVVALVGCGGAPAQEPTEQPMREQASGASSSAASSKKDAQDVAATHALVPLRVEGTRLVNNEGKTVQLKGISTHGLSWFPQYVNAELFGELARDWGANTVRLAMYTAESGGYCTDGNKEQLRQLVLDGVGYATDAGLYAIVDWHILSDNNPLDHADEAQEFFANVSAALADHTNVLYEICNEPNGSTSWADVKAYAERIIPVIRANNPDAVILVGTPEWSQRIDQAAADPLADKNVMYTLHFYAATHKDDLRNRLREVHASGLPVFVSEFGICDASGNGDIDEQSAAAWIDAMDELGVSYVMWNLSNKDESSSAISAACSKVSGFVDDDLSFAGRWLRATLLGDDSRLPKSEQPAVREPGSFSYALKEKNSWPADGKYEVRGTTLVISNESYNGRIAAGGTLSDVGFQLKS